MKKVSIIFLQIIVVVFGVSILALMLWEPHLEGRNVSATLFEIYFKDPFLAYVYIGSIPFFWALYQAFKVLKYVKQNAIFSQPAVSAVRTIKYCAFITAGAIVVADAYLKITSYRNYDDPAGAIMLGIIATVISFVVGITASVFERILQDVVNMKSKKDLGGE